jgi:glycogen debranching enzyme
MFLVADERGDITGPSDGLYHEDTRVLSHYRLSFRGAQPSLLQSGVSPDNVLFTAHLTNDALPPLGGHALAKDVIYLVRTRFIWSDRMFESLELTNYGDREALVPLRLDFAVDFRDMFEVRGERRRARGRLLPTTVGRGRVEFSYEGLDRRVRQSSIAFSHPTSALTQEHADFHLRLPVRQPVTLHIEAGIDGQAVPDAERFRTASILARHSMRTRRRRGGSLRTSDRRFNNWLEQSRSDLALLTTDLPTGPFPYAGVPWFSTPFGRDGIITALQVLWLDPGLARGVLDYLASTQADAISVFHAAQPGKIQHETRNGEMAVMEELPFARYYGGLDTTPLFVMLAGAYAARTGDLATIEGLWPALLRAVAWMDEHGDSNGDGFLDYPNDSATGLTNQNWKDSVDSVFHADGRFPTGPIAPVDVQAYAFAAYHAMAELAERRRDGERAARWRGRAEALRNGVERRFWLDELGFYALALDGKGKPCEVRGSNPGHLLYAGLPSPERAARVATALLSDEFRTGWGLRTLATEAARFNPMSYHNGSVWPHDTAVTAAGLARYGDRLGAMRFLVELFDAAHQFGMRLPELYCGFARRLHQPPVAYPVACLPQAWAAGSVFMALQAALGITIDGWRGKISIDRPALPPSVEWLTIRGIAVGAHRVDLTFRRIAGRVVVVADDAGQQIVPVIVRG